MLDTITRFFVENAWAMAPNPDAQGGGNPIMGFLPLILIFVIFYFLLIRPQQKKQKDHQAMIHALQRGDKVITTGGIYGLVEQVGEKTVTLKIAENTKVKFSKQYIAAVRSTADEE
jgi:preprotein translocase subunit YajC